jgi:nucleoside-diphosphate-sugar epimerase
MDFEKLRIAVTGGSGNIGNQVVRYLVERGHAVINIDQKSRPDGVARFVYMDLRKREFLQPVLEQVDAVMHLGEIPHAGFSSDDYIFSHNVTACATVLSTAADLKLRHVVYTSTCQTYGMWGVPTVPPLALPVTEDHPLQPTNAYALSKVANESYCRFVASQRGLRVTIFRLPWVLNPKWDERTLRWLDKEREPNQTEALGTYLHATDVAPAYEAAVLRNAEGCRTYNLAAPDTLSRLTVQEQLERFFPEWVKPPADWPGDRSVLSTERARQELGWEAKWLAREQYAKVTGKPW